MNFLLKNKFLIIILAGVCILEISIFSICFAEDNLEILTDTTSYGIVNVSTLNLRNGPGKNYDSISKLKLNEQVTIYGELNNWYIVQTSSGLIGAVSSEYISNSNNSLETSSNSTLINPNILLSEDEETFFNLINLEREKANLPPLKLDDSIQNIARLKAKDLVENNYFSHYSKKYGNIFEMLSSNNIQFKNASENIAGNNSIENAVNSFMNSENHKANILSSVYSYTGIAVSESISYGKILVQIFIQK